jgi:hypothetical protein
VVARLLRTFELLRQGGLASGDRNWRVSRMNGELEDSESALRALKFDSAGLGFSRRGDSVFIHYPKRGPDGSTTYGAGVQIPYPFGDPDANEITRERVRIVESLGHGG